MFLQVSFGVGDHHLSESSKLLYRLFCILWIHSHFRAVLFLRCHSMISTELPLILYRFTEKKFNSIAELGWKIQTKLNCFFKLLKIGVEKFGANSTQFFLTIILCNERFWETWTFIQGVHIVFSGFSPLLLFFKILKFHLP